MHKPECLPQLGLNTNTGEDIRRLIKKCIINALWVEADFSEVVFAKPADHR